LIRLSVLALVLTPWIVFLVGCAGGSKRQDTRQDERVETRTGARHHGGGEPPWSTGGCLECSCFGWLCQGQTQLSYRKGSDMFRKLVHRPTVSLSILAAIALTWGVAPAPAAAQDPGNWEFTLAGTGFSDNDFDTTSLGVDLGLGFHLDPLVFGVRQSLSYNTAEAVDDIWSGSTRLFADLEFRFGSIAPFIGANVGYVYGDLVDDQFIAGPEAGLKLYVGDDHDTFIFGRVEYQFFFEDSDDAEDAFDDGQFVYTIGVGFRF